MNTNEFLDLCRRMVVMYWNTYVTPTHQYERVIDIHQVCLEDYEEDSDGHMRMSLVVNGEENKTFNVEYNRYTGMVSSFIN